MSRFFSRLQRSSRNSSPAPEMSSVPDRKYGCKVLHANDNAVADVVMVHGLTGDRMSTWTAENDVCWPRDLLHMTIPDVRVIVFGYDADVANIWSPASQNTIDDHAQALVNAVGILREKDSINHRPLIFIGHSLGGLVIQNALLVSWSSVEAYRQSVIKCTKAIIFLGTPHCGSTMASWAEFGANTLNIIKATNKKILSSLTTGSEVLSGIQDRFHTLLRRLKMEQAINIILICFYEELYVSWIGKKVVPDTSSKLSGYLSEGIHANHMDMTKYRDAEDPGFEKVSNQIWLCLKEISKGVAIAGAVSADATNNSGVDGQSLVPSGMVMSNNSRGDVHEDSRSFGGKLTAPNGGVFKSSHNSFNNVVAGNGAFVGQ